MKNKNYIWIVEAKTSTSKSYKPIFGTFKDTDLSGLYSSRALARNAAKYMTENNQYNKFKQMVYYRAAKYQKL